MLLTLLLHRPGWVRAALSNRVRLLLKRNFWARINMLKLCPSCHVMFDTRLKPRLYEALKNAGVRNFPQSWTKSIDYQAFEVSMKSTKKNLRSSLSIYNQITEEQVNVTFYSNRLC